MKILLTTVIPKLTDRNDNRTFQNVKDFDENFKKTEQCIFR